MSKLVLPKGSNPVELQLKTKSLKKEVELLKNTIKNQKVSILEGQLRIKEFTELSFFDLIKLAFKRLLKGSN